METKQLLTTVLAAVVSVLNAENITVGWPLYPVARKLMAQYEKTTGKTAPELKLSNNQGASPNMRGPDGKETLGYLTMAPEKPLPGMIQIPVCSKGFFLYANAGNPFLERLDKTEIKPETMRKLWRGELFWEELTESRENRRTPVTAVVISPQIPILFGMKPGEKSRAVHMNEQSALKAVSSNRFAISACIWHSRMYPDGNRCIRHQTGKLLALFSVPSEFFRDGGEMFWSDSSDRGNR